MALAKTYLKNTSDWYKDAVIYQLHVKSFYDSNGDGVGDFNGLTQKLDYLKNLGVTAIWLLPFYPSPLKDDGYDISDYLSVHPQYGTLKDFREFLKEAHERDLKVIIELVINHTSDQHPWFQRARKAKPNSNYRNYYVWNSSSDKYKEARIIFKDFELSNWVWDEEAKAYYWHRFYSPQPDLNYENPSVQKEIFRIADFWFSLGVDGMRLDAVPYLFEREGTNCENLPETYEFLKKLRKYVDNKFTNRMLLAEANQWPEDAASYFGNSDECHMAFHFPLMPRMYMAIQMEERFPIIDILEQTPEIPESCQWAIFLRNHDELTLEMVTDEERDYMYRAYARDVNSKINLGIRRRLVPLLGNNRRKIELMNIMLFSMPGTPIVYYGDEIGMGDNRFLGDRNGVRTPMQWSPDRNAGFSKANPQQLYLPVIIDSEYHYETVNVETQDGNLSSSLWWMKRVIAMRKNFPAFGRGSIQFLLPENHKVLSFLRRFNDEIILVVINLSRFSQAVELDLKEFSGYVPQEVFSQNNFPEIKDTPYFITLGPHNHYWFLFIKTQGAQEKMLTKAPQLELEGSWSQILDPKFIKILEKSILPLYLLQCRWFGGKSRHIYSVNVKEVICGDKQEDFFTIAVLNVQYTSGNPESYLLPLSYTEDSAMLRDYPKSILCKISVNGKEGFLYDAAYDTNFHRFLLTLIANKKKIKTDKGQLVGVPSQKFKALLQNKGLNLSSHVLKAEQSNTSIVYEDVYFLKLLRKLEEGINPEREMIRYLTEQKRFDNVPVFAGFIEYRSLKYETIDICLLQAYVSNQGDAWTYTLEHVKSFFELVLSKDRELATTTKPQEPVKASIASASDLIDKFYLDWVKLLGKRTGEMHLSLACDNENPDFKPESFSMLYQRSLYQAMGSQARFVIRLLRENLAKLPAGTQGEAASIIEREKEIFAQFALILKTKFNAKKIRIHGDYHLGQVLFTGKDFVVMDFEGEPARPASERRLKRSALRDVAGMVRSFHYAAYAALFLNQSVRNTDILSLDSAADLWSSKVADVFARSYFETVGKADFLPKDQKALDVLLQAYLLNKAIYELGYELNNRPDWVIIPLRGIKRALEDSMRDTGKQQQ
ncbi:MAG: maltose alpha-D-glucosyltransferase [Candidatus Omnitrophota bacterium]